MASLRSVQLKVNTSMHSSQSSERGSDATVCAMCLPASRQASCKTRGRVQARYPADRRSRQPDQPCWVHLLLLLQQGGTDCPPLRDLPRVLCVHTIKPADREFLAETCCLGFAELMRCRLACLLQTVFYCLRGTPNHFTVAEPAYRKIF